MDIYHKLFCVARKGVIHSAPILPGYDRTRILDLGTGTGIWAIEMAEYVLCLTSWSALCDLKANCNFVVNLEVRKFWGLT